MAPRKKALNFEKALSELEQLVEDMESGELTLEDSLKSFEKGVNLTRECQQALSDAEQKVELLLTTETGIEQVPFDEKNSSKEL